MKLVSYMINEIKRSLGNTARTHLKWGGGGGRERKRNSSYIKISSSAYWLKSSTQLSMVTDAFNSSILETGAGTSFEFKASLVYIMSFRTNGVM